MGLVNLRISLGSMVMVTEVKLVGGRQATRPAIPQDPLPLRAMPQDRHPLQAMPQDRLPFSLPLTILAIKVMLVTALPARSRAMMALAAEVASPSESPRASTVQASTTVQAATVQASTATVQAVSLQAAMLHQVRRLAQEWPQASASAATMEQQQWPQPMHRRGLRARMRRLRPLVLWGRMMGRILVPRWVRKVPPRQPVPRPFPAMPQSRRGAMTITTTGTVAATVTAMRPAIMAAGLIMAAAIIATTDLP